LKVPDEMVASVADREMVNVREAVKAAHQILAQPQQRLASPSKS